MIHPSEHTYKTVSGVIGYIDPTTGRMLHLVINQAIHIPHLDHHLLCPMQCRVNDVTVDETPKFLATRPTEQMRKYGRVEGVGAGTADGPLIGP
jgi:NCAIR mutase (PurE)-related protein